MGAGPGQPLEAGGGGVGGVAELGVPTVARGHSAGRGYGPGLLVTETVTNGQTFSFSSTRSEWLRSEDPRLLGKKAGQEVIPLPGWGWGLGTP